MAEKDPGSDLEQSRSRKPAEPGVAIEEYIGPGFQSRGLYGDVSGLNEQADERTAEPDRGRYVGRGPRSYRRSDSRIAEDINEALTWHPDIDASEVEVVVEQGEVTLTGIVDDLRTRRLIVDVTAQIPGVCGLADRLSVAGGKTSGT